MKFIHVLAASLVVVGVLNWGLGALFRFDVVPVVLGDATGLMVGATAVFEVLQWLPFHRTAKA